MIVYKEVAFGLFLSIFSEMKWIKLWNLEVGGSSLLDYLWCCYESESGSFDPPYAMNN